MPYNHGAVTAFLYWNKGKPMTVGGPSARSAKVEAPWRDLLGTMSDTELADMYHLRRATVSLTRKGLGIPAFGSVERGVPKEGWKEVLGTMPDKDVALEYNVSLSTVQKTRKSLGILYYLEEQHQERLKNRLVDWKPLAGKVNDKALAAQACIGVNTVRNYRKLHKIPVFKEVK